MNFSSFLSFLSLVSFLSFLSFPVALLQCESGKWSFLNGNTFECQDCTKGRFNKYPGQIHPDSCLPCPSGYYQTTAGSSKCIECPSGRFQTDVQNNVHVARCDTFACAHPTLNKGPIVACRGGFTKACNNEDCCASKAKCSTFACVEGNNLGANIDCVGDRTTCVKEDCCTSKASCNMHGCPQEKFNIGNTIFCLGDHVNTCTDETCCSNELKCSTFTCPNTYELYANASQLNCINGVCDASVCCAQLAVVASKCSTMDISVVCAGAQYTGSLKSGGT